MQAANESFYGKLMSAQATSFMNYGSISGISKNTANYYIEQGISQATALSLNYGCSKPVVSDEAAARFTGDVNAAWESINDKIEQIKANKKTQYEGYQTYLAQGGGNPISPDYMNKFNYLMNYIGVLVVLVRSQANASFANSRLESTLEQMIDIKDVKKRSLKERIHFVDTIAAILIGVFPEVTYEIGRQYKVPIQGGYIYYGTNVNEKLRPGAESPINVLVDSERDKFKDFSVSTGMGGVLVTFNSKGIVTISGQTDMGTSRADVSMKLDTSTGKAFGEYSSTVNAQGKISLTTILGFEKDLDVDRPKDNGGGINWSTVVSVVSWAAIGLGGIGIVAKAVAMGSKALPALGFLGV